ncbi:MAG: hypothetical protein AAF609_05000 [Cyanobacteria bacterium P01_C01_bin.120]
MEVDRYWWAGVMGTSAEALVRNATGFCDRLIVLKAIALQLPERSMHLASAVVIY